MSSAQGAGTGKETAQCQTGGLEAADSRLLISTAGQRKYTLGIKKKKIRANKKRSSRGSEGGCPLLWERTDDLRREMRVWASPSG